RLQRGAGAAARRPARGGHGAGEPSRPAARGARAAILDGAARARDRRRHGDLARRGQDARVPRDGRADPRDGGATVNDRGTDERLRDALQALAAGVPEAPEDYRAASSGWRRRERRRRLVLAVLAAVVFVVA